MKFDVFVSFRGDDTGRSFVSHLCHSLRKKQFTTFKDEEYPLGNQPAFPHVLQAIEESKVAVVVISANYTSSLACLDELVKIIECKEKQSLVVVPVFYEVDPSYFEGQADYLADQLKKHAERDNLENVNWKPALIEFSRTFQNYASRVEEDSDMIDKVMDYLSPHLSETLDSEGVPNFVTVCTPRTRRPIKMLQNLVDSFITISKMHDDDELILQDSPWGSVSGVKYETDEKPIGRVEPKLWSMNSLYEGKYATENKWSSIRPSGFCGFFFGMDRHVRAVNTLLELESMDRVLEIGIWGDVGVGKTTLMKYVHGQISPKFQDHYYHSFLDDTTKFKFRPSNACLLEELTRTVMTQMSRSRLTRYRDVVKAKLKHRNVLLILDGVDQMFQVKNIREIAQSFGPGSRLVLVTKDKTLLQHEVSRLYEVESLKFDEALQLFSQFAFKKRYILEGFDQLCIRAVLIAGRLPLALKVLGSFLCGKSIKEWDLELLKLEASQANCTAVVSSYIRAGFYGRQPTKLDRYVVEDDDEGDEFPSYYFA